MNGKTALVFSIVVVVSALGFLIYTGLSDNMVYYYHVDEFLPKAESLSGETIKVNGKVVEGSIRKTQMQEYDFVICGATKTNLVHVSYHGVVPDTFKENAGVLLEGKYVNGEFHAARLFTKCASKYESENGGQYPASEKSSS